MNLIEQLGGYENCKKEYELAKKEGWRNAVLNMFSMALLEYRRAHNIFEEGDAMVIPSRGNGIFYFNAFFFDGDIAEARHVTDAEIKAGHRL